jgi:hypothetical protein
MGRSDLADFRSFDIVMLTLFRMLLGNFDYLAMHRSNFVIAPFLFASYIICIVWLLLNMLAALCADSYAQLAHKVQHGPVPFAYQCGLPVRTA